MSRKNRRRAEQPDETPRRESRGESRQLPALNWAVILALFAATVVAYIPALNAPFVLDDAPTIEASAQWIAPPGSPTAGRPLVLLTLGTNYALNSALGVKQRPDPDDPSKAVAYRLFNLLVHMLTGALLFGVLRRAMREKTIDESWRAIADPVAAFVCALWLLHPIQSEVVNYIVQRSESMASLCYLAVLYASQRAWESEMKPRWYAVAVIACALGMASKEIVITAPLAVMLYDRAFRLPSWRALLRPGDGRGFLYVALWVASIGTFALFGIGARGETAGSNAHIAWYSYLYTQCWAIARYLQLVVWPHPLAVDYGIDPIHGMRGVPGAVLLAAFGIVTLAAWTRVPKFGWFAFLGSMFFILLAPSSSVVPIVSEVAAERRIYLALAVVLVLIVVAAESLRRRFAAGVPAKRVAIGFAGIAALLAVTTAARSRTYASVEALSRSAALAMPDNPRALGNLGWALYKSPTPKLAEAESVFAVAAARDSTCHFGCLQYGAVLISAGRVRDAIPFIESQLALNPGDVLAARTLGLAYMKAGDYQSAIAPLELVAAKLPRMDHIVVLGIACLSAGHRDEAVELFKHVAEIDGGDPEMQRLSARLLDGVNRPDALPDLQKFAAQLSSDWM
jgi:protein O-mannosyl-transferase